MEDCTHDDGQSTLFCGLCGKERERGSLKRIRLDPSFKGPGSHSKKVQHFLNTGDPAVFASPGAPDYDPALDHATR